MGRTSSLQSVWVGSILKQTCRLASLRIGMIRSRDTSGACRHHRRPQRKSTMGDSDDTLACGRDRSSRRLLRPNPLDPDSPVIRPLFRHPLLPARPAQGLPLCDTILDPLDDHGYAAFLRHGESIPPQTEKSRRSVEIYLDTPKVSAKVFLTPIRYCWATGGDAWTFALHRSRLWPVSAEPIRAHQQRPVSSDLPPPRSTPASVRRSAKARGLAMVCRRKSGRAVGSGCRHERRRL